jgi:uncharacterized protein (TIGR00299 family) protein
VRLGYFDCFAGASGDMILACLFDVGLSKQTLADGLSGIGINDIDIVVDETSRKEFRAKSFSFKHRPASERRTYPDIVAAIDAATLSDFVKTRSKAAFELLAEAESKVHGADKDEIHFHEIGSLDSIVDVVGALVGLEALGLECVLSSPLALGTGSVRCEHGTIPVPAPATLEIARDLPVRGWGVPGEMTTPTGAAILKTCASGFGEIPRMVVEAVGYGAGTRDLPEIPNIMRLIVGEARGLDHDEVVLVETNIDDMNPQMFSHLYEDLFGVGALDVWVTNVLMKKGRPGFLLSILCERPHVPEIVQRVLAGTTTAGVRLRAVDRIKLDRKMIEIETRFGRVRAKVFALDSTMRCAPEYDDCVRLARSAGVPVSEVMEEAKHAYRTRPEASS